MRVGFTHIVFSLLDVPNTSPLTSKNYLRKVNDVPPSYNIGKLCTEDPILLSHRFSQKFHFLSKGITQI